MPEIRRREGNTGIILKVGVQGPEGRPGVAAAGGLMLANFQFSFLTSPSIPFNSFRLPPNTVVTDIIVTLIDTFDGSVEARLNIGDADNPVCLVNPENIDLADEELINIPQVVHPSKTYETEAFINMLVVHANATKGRGLISMLYYPIPDNQLP